jgi:hypothetical protein
MSIALVNGEGGVVVALANFQAVYMLILEILILDSIPNIL